MSRRLLSLARLSEHRAACAALSAALPVLAGLVLFALKGVPHPTIHDEFSYLYAADTFSHGRLSNPPHPLWPHFESFDLLMQPTMASRKPPAQGLFLAAGQVLFGRPIAGVLLSAGLAAAAVYWMLLAFVEPPWALLVAALAGTHPLLFSWEVSYWGGAAALLGGALAVGGWKRLLSSSRPGDGALFGLGLSVLASSRPFEGFVLAAPLCASLLWRLRGRRLSALAPAALVLAAAGAWTALLNYRVTGSAFEFPYTLYERTYNPAPLFIWQPIGPLKTYRDKEFENYYDDWELGAFRGQDTAAGYPRFVADKLAKLSRAWLQPLPAALLLAAALFWPATRALAVLLAALVLAVTMPVRATTFAYFSAPLGGLFFAVLALALRRLDAWRRGGRLLVILTALWSAGNSLAQYWAYARAEDNSWSLAKEEVRGRLLSEPGQHLVLVRYGPQHTVAQEWVYNDADMDASPVIWARSLSEREDRELEDYYPARSVWELEFDFGRTRYRLLRPPKRPAS